MVDRTERLNSLLRREVAEAFYKVFAGGGLDLAAVTVTRVETAPNLRNATVFVSVYGHDDEHSKILGILSRHASDMQALINKNCHLKYTPRLHFRYDPSIERGDRVLDALFNLPPPAENETPQ